MDDTHTARHRGISSTYVERFADPFTFLLRELEPHQFRNVSALGVDDDG
jgi:hypothetical protein